MSVALLEAALGYAAMDWPVFPLAPRSKVPPRGSHGVKDATADADRIEAWWRREPEANIGLACGVAFWALDVDYKGIDPPGSDGVDALAELKRRYGPLPITVTNLTGGGGWQFLFNPDGRVKNQIAVLPGLDMRSSDGYIVAPPSIHPDTNNRYRWRPGFEPGEIEIATAPEWLIAFVEPVELPEPPFKTETTFHLFLEPRL